MVPANSCSISRAPWKGGTLTTPNALLLSFVATTLSLSGISDRVSLAINQLVGRSRAFDSLVALPLHNDLIKAAVIGACFFAAWFGPSAPADVLRARKVLITTLLASILAIAASKLTSHSVFYPRPFVQTQKIYLLDGDHLVESKRVPYRMPLGRAAEDESHALSQGNLDENDLGTFPSDHASFFVAISLGVFLAARGAGTIALFWTFVVVLGGKILAGQHTVLDTLGGVAIAVAALAFCQFVTRRWASGALDRAAQWTVRHGALSSAILFIAVFEIASTLTHLPPLFAVLKKLALGGRK